MYSIKWSAVVILGFVGFHVVCAAPRPTKDIPVHVIYDNPHDLLTLSQDNSDDKESLKLLAEEPYRGNPVSLRNHDEKLQLSPQQLREAPQHFPAEIAAEEAAGLLRKQAETVPGHRERNNAEKVQLSDEELYLSSASGRLGPGKAGISQQVSSTANTNPASATKIERYAKAEATVVAGFKEIESKLINANDKREWQKLYVEVPKIFHFFNVNGEGVSERNQYRKITNEIKRLADQYVERIAQREKSVGNFETSFANNNPHNNVAAFDVVNNGLNKITNTLRNLDPLPESNQADGLRIPSNKQQENKNKVQLANRNKPSSDASTTEERYHKAQAQVIAGFKQIEDKLQDTHDAEAVKEWQKLYEEVPNIFNFFGRNDKIDEKEKLRKISVEIKRLGAQYLAKITNENNPILITQKTSTEDYKVVVQNGVEKITQVLKRFDPSVKQASSLLTREERYKKGQDAVLHGFKEIEQKLSEDKRGEWRKLYEDIPRIFKFFDVKFGGQVDEKEQFRKISVEVKRLSDQFLDKYSEGKLKVNTLPVVANIVRSNVDDITNTLNNRYGAKNAVIVTEAERYQKAQEKVLKGFKSIERKLVDSNQKVDIEEWQKLYADIPKIFDFFNVKGVTEEEKLQKITIEVKRLGNQFLENVFINGKSVLEAEVLDPSQIVTIGVIQISDALKNYNLRLKDATPKEERYRRAETAVVSSFKEIEKQLQESNANVNLKEWRKLYADIPKIFQFFDVKTLDVTENEKFTKVSRELERLGNQFVQKINEDKYPLRSNEPITKIVHDAVDKISDNLKNYDVSFRQVSSEEQRYKKAQDSVMNSFKEVEKKLFEPNDLNEWRNLYQDLKKIFDFFDVDSHVVPEKEKFLKISVELKRLSEQFLDRVNVEHVEAKTQSNVKYIVHDGLDDIADTLQHLKSKYEPVNTIVRQKRYQEAEEEVLTSFKKIEKKLLESEQPVDVISWRKLYDDVPEIFKFFDVKSPEITEEEQYRKISKEVRRLSEQFIEKANAAKLKSSDNVIYEIISEPVTKITNSLLQYTLKSESHGNQRYLAAEATVAFGFRDIGKKLVEAGKLEEAKEWEKTYTEIPNIFEFFNVRGSERSEEEKYRKISVQLQLLKSQFLEKVDEREKGALKNQSDVITKNVKEEVEKIAHDLRNIKPEAKQSISKEEQYKRVQEKVIADFKEVEKKIQNPEQVKEWKDLYHDIPNIFKFFDVKSPEVSEEEKYRKIGNEVTRLGGQFIQRLQANKIKDKPVVSVVRKEVKEKIAQVISTGINKISNNLENFQPTASISTNENGDVVSVKTLKRPSPIVHVSKPMNEEERYKKAQHIVLTGFKQIEHNIAATKQPERVQEWKKLYLEVPKIFKFFDVKSPEISEREKLQKVENEVRRLANQYVEKLKAEEVVPVNEVVISGLNNISNTLNNYEKVPQRFPNSKSQRYLRAQAAVLEAFRDIEKELEESQGPLEVSEWRKLYADVPRIFDFFNMKSDDISEKEQYRKITIEIRRLGDQYVEKVKAEREKIGKMSSVNELVNGKVGEISEALNNYEAVRQVLMPISTEKRYKNAETMVKDGFVEIEKQLTDEEQKKEWKSLYQDIPRIFQFFDVHSKEASEMEKYQKVSKEVRRLSGQFLEKMNPRKTQLKSGPSVNEIINSGMTELSNTLSYFTEQGFRSAISYLSREDRYKLAQEEVLDEFKEIEKKMEKVEDSTRVQEWRNLYTDVPKIFDFFDIKSDAITEEEQFQKITVQLKRLTTQFVEKVEAEDLKFGLKISSQNAPISKVVNEGLEKMKANLKNFNPDVTQIGPISKEEIRYHMAQGEVIKGFKEIEKHITDPQDVKEWRLLYSEIPRIFEFFDMKSDKISEQEKFRKIGNELKRLGDQYLIQVSKKKPSNLDSDGNIIKQNIGEGPNLGDVINAGINSISTALSNINPFQQQSGLAQNAAHDPVTEDAVPSPTKDTAQPPSPTQGPQNPIMQGFQSISNTANQVVQAITGQNNNNNPSGTTSDVQPTGPIQQIFQQVFGINQQAPGGTSGDTPVPAPQNPNPIQLAFQNIGNAANQGVQAIFQGQSTQAPGSTSDTGTGGNPSIGPIQQAINGVGQVFNNVINPSNPTAAPGSVGDTPNPVPGIGGQNVFQSIQSTFQNIFNQPAAGSQGDTQPAPPSTGPLQGFQNFVSGGIAQIGNQLQSMTGGSNNNNPINTIQNAIQNNQNLIPTIPNTPNAPGTPNAPVAPTPPPQNEEQPGPAPAGGTQGVQNFANQISSAISSGAAGAQQQAQNVANQVGAAINNPSPTGTPSGAPQQQVQNLVNQVGAAINGNPPASGSDVIGSIQGLAGPSGQIKSKPQSTQQHGVNKHSHNENDAKTKSKTKIEQAQVEPIKSRTADEETIETEIMQAVE